MKTNNYKNFAINAKKVIVDLDFADIDKLEFKIDLIFHNDAKIFMEDFFSKLNEIKFEKTWNKWLSYCNKIIL